MPRLDYSVTGPQAGAVVGRSIAVSGVARVLTAASGSLLEITISGVQIEFGAGGPVLDAHLANGAWSCTGSLLPSVPGGTQVTLTAVLRGTNGFSGPGSPNDVARVEPFEEHRPVSVQVAVAPPPAFTVTAPADGAVIDLHEGGAEVDMALTIPGDQFFPVTISISPGRPDHQRAVHRCPVPEDGRARADAAWPSAHLGERRQPRQRRAGADAHDNWPRRHAAASVAGRYPAALGQRLGRCQRRGDGADASHRPRTARAGWPGAARALSPGGARTPA